MQLPFEPMQLERQERPFADPNWLYQVKWDGVRNLCLVENGQVRHWSRRLRDRTAQFPEFGGLGNLFGGRRAVLDGEIIVLKAGKPSFSGILERDLATRPPTGSGGGTQGGAGHPAVLMLFDLLELGTEPLYNRPLEERLALLQEWVTPGEAWQVVASFPGTEGPDLFQAVVTQELEGVVAKRRQSLYLPGSRSRDWVKIKRKLQMLALVIGYTQPVGRPGGLLLGAYRAGQLRYIGRVGSGLSSADLATIRAHLRPIPCPFPHPPSLRDRFAGEPGPVVWVAPQLTLQVSFSEWTEEQRLRHPVVVGFSTEPPEAAVLP